MKMTSEEFQKKYPEFCKKLKEENRKAFEAGELDDELRDAASRYKMLKAAGLPIPPEISNMASAYARMQRGTPGEVELEAEPTEAELIEQVKERALNLARIEPKKDSDSIKEPEPEAEIEKQVQERAKARAGIHRG